MNEDNILLEIENRYDKKRKNRLILFGAAILSYVVVIFGGVVIGCGILRIQVIEYGAYKYHDTISDCWQTIAIGMLFAVFGSLPLIIGLYSKENPVA